MRLSQHRVPWGAWFGDGTHDILLPADWHTDLLRPPRLPALDDDAIELALAQPDGTVPLTEAAMGARTACVVVDDLARPTRLNRILPIVLSQIEAAGVPRRGITVLIATGTHSAPTRQQIAGKVGRTVARAWRVKCHDANRGLLPAGTKYGGRELSLAEDFVSAEVRVLVGTVMPHPLAGFSGGAKLIIPGISDLDAAERAHSIMMMGFRRQARRGSSPFRDEIERLVSRLGVALAVAVMPNFEREPALVVAGDSVRSHRTAVRAAIGAFGTPFDDTYDCMVLNAYPKDIDLVQSLNALATLEGYGRSPIRRGGSVVLATAASSGVGSHGLFGPSGRCYRAPSRHRALQGAELILYSPNLTERAARKLLWSGYPFFSDARSVAERLAATQGTGSHAAIVPAACQQLLVDRRKPTGGILA